MSTLKCAPPETAPPRRVLAIEDDPHIQSLLEMIFQATEFRLLSAVSGWEGLTVALEHHPDIILLDLRLPGLDGYDVCHRLREFSAAPIIILSGSKNESEIVRGLEVGADDYVCKPFSPGELLARMRAQLRAHARVAARRRYLSFDDAALEIDLDSQTVRLRGEAVAMSPTDFRLLAYLAANAGRVVPHKELLRYALGANAAHLAPYLKVYIGRVRQRLGDTGHPPRLLHSVRNVGYRFIARSDAERAEPEAGSA